jgi:hypothetical protein
MYQSACGITCNDFVSEHSQINVGLFLLECSRFSLSVLVRNGRTYCNTSARVFIYVSLISGFYICRQKPLYYLETDVGQTEFTPPGVLSLTKVDTPIFG